MSENSAWDLKLLREPALLATKVAQAVEDGREREAISNLVKMLLDLPQTDTEKGAQASAGDVTGDPLKDHVPSPTTSLQV